MMPATEFQKLVGLIRGRDELAPLRHVPLDRLRTAVNDIAGSTVAEGDIESIAREMRCALEGWLSRPPVPFEPLPARLPRRAIEPARDPAPRAGIVAAACQAPARKVEPLRSESLSHDTAAAHPVRVRSPAWRLVLPACWAAFAGGVALVFVAAGWSPGLALDLLSSAALEAGRRALTGDALGLGVGLALAGLIGIVVTNLWALFRPSGRTPA